MIPILTPAESAELDRQSQDRGVTVDSLMENAGRAVARATAALVGGTYGRRAVVVCGKGNNGGDGLVAARYLLRWGMGATAVLLAGRSDFRGPAAVNLRRFERGGGRVVGADRLPRELARAGAVVDAIFGTGFRGAPKDDFAGAIEAVIRSGLPVVAVDIPSGVDGETGAVAGAAVRADLTVTFGAAKPGVVFFPGAEHAGEVHVVDIGFPDDLLRSDLGLVEPEDVAPLLPRRLPEGHKRSTGVVLVLAGSRAMTGAAVLAASAAYRAGAGLVTVAVPGGILPVVEEHLVETTFLPLPETADGTVAAGAHGPLMERLAGVHALAVGPGLTTQPETAELIRRLVAGSPVPMVVDADGLNAFAGRATEVRERRSDAVLTPHAGELSRLTSMSSADITGDRVEAARKASVDFNCAVLLKGTRTVVARTDGRCTVNPTGGPYLATAGTGDVLTGTVAALLARGLSPGDAAMAGAYVHGEAGRLAAERYGEGVVASDVAGHLPAAIRRARRGSA